MKILLYLSLLLCLMQACSQPTFNNKEKQEAIDALNNKENILTRYYCDSTEIEGGKFIACLFNESDSLYIINPNNDTSIISVEDGGPEFRDFNKDGYEDLYIGYNSNVPGVEDLALYNVKTKSFDLIDDLKLFPASIKIEGTDYYYSYHRSGCADMNWDSDLFYIEDNKTIKIGNIEGIGCDDEKPKVSISSIKGDSVLLIETLAIDTIYSYKDFKWGFIKEYWSRNYKGFI